MWKSWRWLGPPTNIIDSCFLCMSLLQIGGTKHSECSSIQSLMFVGGSSILCCVKKESFLLPAKKPCKLSESESEWRFLRRGLGSTKSQRIATQHLKCSIYYRVLASTCFFFGISTMDVVEKRDREVSGLLKDPLSAVKASLADPPYSESEEVRVRSFPHNHASKQETKNQEKNFLFFWWW